MYSPIFNEIVRPHIITEGGLVNNPLDPGGLTKYGIAQRYHPNVDVANLTVEGAMDIYYEEYWKPMKLDLLWRKEVAAEMFDTGAGPNGIYAAIMIAQGALVLLKANIKVDGIMGPITAKHLNTYPYPEDLVKMMNLLQFTHLLVGSANIPETIEMIKGRLPQLREFMRGWLKRIAI